MRRQNLPRLGLLPALAALVLTSCVSTARLEQILAAAPPPAQTTKILAADGTLLTTLHAEENREVVPIDRVPPVARRAVVAAEDARFYAHGGVDVRAVARALFANAEEGRVVEGGSTITQQYVKNVLVGRARTVKRKLREASLAIQLERRFTKDQILERYLNTVYFGQGAYGIEAAALTFFRRHAEDLTLPQAALLAGLIRSPGRYDPFAEPRRALARRNWVLRRMRELGDITPREEARARREALGARRPRTGRYPAAYFVEYVKDLVQNDARFGSLGGTVTERIDALFKGGLRIETTLDPRVQRAAEETSRRVLHDTSDPHNAFVALRPADGAIVAMVGGRDFFDGKDPVARFNLAVQSRRQPGSAFKPFTLVGALEQGIALDSVWRGGSQITVPTPGGPWLVHNYGNQSFGSRLTLLRATALSVNVVYAQVVARVGPAGVVEAARRMGITSPLAPYYSIALGAQEVSPLEMADAYGTLANGGYRVEPTAVTRITGPNGQVLYEAKPARKRALAPETVALATTALREVIRSGTGHRLQIGRPAAGKTGTTEEYADAWFAGFTRDLVGVSWVGFPRGRVSMRPPRTRIQVVGGSWPGEIWRDVMVAAHEGLPVRDFLYGPGSLVEARVDSSRGCLANQFTPPTLVQVRTYVRGHVPPVCTEPSGPEIAGTPNVLGKPAGEASRALERAGFAVEAGSRYCPAYLPGTVCAQEPAPGVPARIGDRARIWVSDDSAKSEVPVVLGLTEDEARAALDRAGLEARVVEAANADGSAGCRDRDEARAGYVWLQDPCGGAIAGAGSTVTISVNPASAEG